MASAHLRHYAVDVYDLTIGKPPFESNHIVKLQVAVGIDCDPELERRRIFSSDHPTDWRIGQILGLHKSSHCHLTRVSARCDASGEPTRCGFTISLWKMAKSGWGGTPARLADQEGSRLWSSSSTS